MNFRTRRRPDDVELNFVPLIDVLVVLLIFLMVTTSFSRLGQLKVELPQAVGEGVASTIHEIPMAISATGAYTLNSISISADDRAGLIAALKQEAGSYKDPVLVLSVDRNTPHERVIAAMTAAIEAKLETITFAVETVGAAP